MNLFCESILEEGELLSDFFIFINSDFYIIFLKWRWNERALKFYGEKEIQIKDAKAHRLLGLL